MSFAHKHAVENTEFPQGKRADGRVISQSSIKAVLIVLASHANDGEPNPKLKNLSWPSNETLAEESKCSVSTVKRVLAWARHLGFFKGVINRQKAGQTTRYLFRDVIEVDGKEMFSRGSSQELPGGESQELPWEAPRELVGSSLGHKEVVPQEPLPRPPGASSGSLGATNTINKTSTEGFQLKAVREAYKLKLAAKKETKPSKQTELCEICGRETNKGKCSEYAVEHLGPVAEEVLSDFRPRYENREKEYFDTEIMHYKKPGLTLIWVDEEKDSKLYLPIPRPETIITLYLPNIKNRATSGPCTEYSISRWEDWFELNCDRVVLPEGTKEYNLSANELEAFRAKSIWKADLPCEYDIVVALGEIHKVFPGDDEEFESFKDNVWTKYEELVEKVPPLYSALFAKPDD